MDIYKLAQDLKSGKIGVIPTDTIYGIVGSALIPKTVERIYKLKKRDTGKPFIILISSSEDLKIFNISISVKIEQFLKKIWPGKVSVILDLPEKNNLKYLHRGTNSLSFRLPDNPSLIKLLKISGPLVSPSANLEGEKESESIDQAKKYFGGNVDFYIDGGKIKSKPSTLIKIKNNEITILRKGAVEIEDSSL